MLAMAVSFYSDGHRIAADRRQRVLGGKSELVAPSELFAPDAKSAEVRARIVGGPPGMDVRTPPVTLESAGSASWNSGPAASWSASRRVRCCSSPPSTTR